MNWYYFRLHKIFQDGTGEVNVEKVERAEIPSNARKLSEKLFDLPGGNCLWHGYIHATDKKSAESRVIMYWTVE